MFAVRQSEMWYKSALPYPSPLAKVHVGNTFKCNQPHPAARGVWRPCKCGYSGVMPQLQAPWQCMNSTAVGKIHREDFANTFAGWNFVLEAGVSCNCEKGGSLSFIAEVRGGPEQGSLYCSNLYLILFIDVNRRFTLPTPKTFSG